MLILRSLFLLDIADCKFYVDKKENTDNGRLEHRSIIRVFIILSSNVLEMYTYKSRFARFGVKSKHDFYVSGTKYKTVIGFNSDIHGVFNYLPNKLYFSLIKEKFR